MINDAAKNGSKEFYTKMPPDRVGHSCVYFDSVLQDREDLVYIFGGMLLPSTPIVTGTTGTLPLLSPPIPGLSLSNEIWKFKLGEEWECISVGGIYSYL
jgi:hypothetical protein